ncbi:MAG: hypothetical protein Q8R96_02205 [Bacteroidota bacterium]|nr:hypothetical protein [Bacteroidota bacterium]
MKESKSKKILPRLLITLLGVAFILWGLTDIMLGLFGESATAVITDIRREGGERNETIRGRYTYIISYSFTLPNGKSYSSYTRKIGNSVFLKPDGKSKVKVKYFSSFPFINATEQDTKPGFGQLIIMAIGFFLIYIINRWNSE